MIQFYKLKSCPTLESRAAGNEPRGISLRGGQFFYEIQIGEKPYYRGYMFLYARDKHFRSRDGNGTVTETVSKLGSFILNSGGELVYEPDDAPMLEGMTYEATWVKSGSIGIVVYLYEENYAVLEISASEEKTENTGSEAMRFLVIPGTGGTCGRPCSCFSDEKARGCCLNLHFSGRRLTPLLLDFTCNVR